MTETRGLRRAEFAVAAFGLTAFLLALVNTLEALRFHGATLLAALAALARGEVDGRGLLLITLAFLGVIVLSRAAISIGRGVSVHRRLGALLPVLAEAEIGGRQVRVVPGTEPRAFCGGLWRPRVYLSEGALARLGARELSAVVAHEGHHADRRDPLRILIARAIGDAYSLRALPRREQALAELAADAAAVRRDGRAPLAAAMLAFEDVAPERVDRLAGPPPADEVPRGLIAGAALVIVALVAILAADVVVPGHPWCCLPLATAPGWMLCAFMAPAWLGWRRAGAFLG